MPQTKQPTDPNPTTEPVCSYCGDLLEVDNPESYKVGPGRYWCGCDEGEEENSLEP